MLNKAFAFWCNDAWIGFVGFYACSYFTVIKNLLYKRTTLFLLDVHLSCSEAELGMKTNTFKNLECWNFIEMMSVVLILEEKTDVSKWDEK